MFCGFLVLIIAAALHLFFSDILKTLLIPNVPMITINPSCWRNILSCPVRLFIVICLMGRLRYSRKHLSARSGRIYRHRRGKVWPAVRTNGSLRSVHSVTKRTWYRTGADIQVISGANVSINRFEAVIKRFTSVGLLYLLQNKKAGSMACLH